MLYFVIKESVSFITSDGVRLDADLYRPDSEQSFPVLLMRQPYNKEIASTVVYAHPTWYASHGYIVVIQDVRGCGTSQGTFTLFEREIEDGYETVNWAANLPGSTGEVGMYGFSYQGMTQLYAAVGRPEPLKVICPAMLAYDIYEDWAYENGAFCYEITLAWAIQMAALQAQKQNDETAYNLLYSASRNLPIYEISLLLKKYLIKYTPSNFYYEWLGHPSPGKYWDRLSPKSYLDSVDLPMLHIGGAFDAHLRGTVKLYKEMSSRSRFPQSLIIGPWSGFPWGRRVGEINYGPEALSNIDRLQIAWFDIFLKGSHSYFCPVSWFEIGPNQYRHFESWPNNEQTVFFLSSSGLANIREDDGILTLKAEERALRDVLVHDPWRPVPSLGGHATLVSGSRERSILDSRSDVLTYTSLPISGYLAIAGDITVELNCQSLCSSFDLCVTLSEVTNQGTVYNFSQGFLHVNTSFISALEISLQPTCYHIPSGHSLRLSISGSCFPAIALNTSLTTLHLLGGKITLSTIS